METTETNYLTPEQLETGLLHENVDRTELDKLLTNFVHENENIDTLMNFFLQYLPGNRKMQDFIDRSKSLVILDWLNFSVFLLFFPSSGI